MKHLNPSKLGERALKRFKWSIGVFVGLVIFQYYTEIFFSPKTINTFTEADADQFPIELR
jgi:hypothetical protein